MQPSLLQGISKITLSHSANCYLALQTMGTGACQAPHRPEQRPCFQICQAQRESEEGGNPAMRLARP